MRLSVVIPTYNKLPLLERTLAALAAQELPANHWETIVVDDGSSDGTADFLAQWSGDPARNLRVVSPGRNVGRASARNLGIRAAAGQWILFLDDDILAPPGLLAAHLEMLQRSPGCGTIGRVRTESALVDGLHFHYLDSRGIAKIRQSNVPARYFVTQNAAVPRRALLNINGFDEEFAAYGLEDMEVAFRLEEQQGIAFLPLHRPIPIHVHHHTLDQLLSKRYEVGRQSLALLARLHPHRIREMRLDWVVDVPGATCRSPLCWIFRRLTEGGIARVLTGIVRRWPVKADHRPVAEQVCYHLFDALVLATYREGITKSTDSSAIMACL